MRSIVRFITAGAGAAILVASLQGCSTEQEAENDTAPIRLGDMSTLSGPYHFPESIAAAHIAFSKINEAGGINGRPIEYIQHDDENNPERTRMLAQELVEEDNIVAFVGGASATSCGVNASYYEEMEIASIPGNGTEPVCFNSANISPPDAGFHTGTVAGLTYAYQTLEPRHLCLVGNAHPSIPGNFDGAIARFERITGGSVDVLTQELGTMDAPEPVFSQIEMADCDVVFAGVMTEMGAGLMQLLSESDNETIRMVFPPEVCGAEYAAGMAARMDGRLYCFGQMEVLTSDNPAMQEIVAQLEEAGEPVTQFAIGGYLSATIIADVLRGMDGPITRQTVLAELRQLSDYDTRGLTGMPYAFGPGESHNSNRAGRPVVLDNQQWVPATQDWFRLPEEPYL